MRANRPKLSASQTPADVLGGSPSGGAGGPAVNPEALTWESPIGPRSDLPAVAVTPAPRPHLDAIPAGIESERGLLGSLLLDEVATWPAVESHGITPTDFYYPQHAEVFKAALALHKAGKPIDSLTVTEELERRGLLDKVGGAMATARLVDDCPTTAHAPFYASQVAESSAKRRIATMAASWAQDAANGQGAAELLAGMRDAIQAEESRHVGNTPNMVSLVDLAEQEIDAGETLIGARACRYLERGAVLMLAAPAGVGKSHLATQAAVSWSCGRSAFGLPTAAGPLRVLIVQAENPPNDARGMARNMVNGLGLTNDERALVAANTRQVWLPGTTGDACLRTVGAIMRAWFPDLVFIDPLAGFSDGDLTKPEVAQRFCRTGLGRLAVDHRAALFVLHHVPKPNAQRDAGRTGAYDWQYAGAGSADLVANWPRAVLSLQTLSRGEFLLRAAKRRPPWAHPDGTQAWELGLRHTPDGTWTEFQVDAATARTGGRPAAPDPETYRAEALALVEKSGAMPKTTLEDRLRAKVTGTRYQARAVLALLLADASLATWRGTGKGGPSLVGLPKHRPAPEEEA